MYVCVGRGVVCWRGVVISMRDATPVCQQTSQNNASADHVVWADGRPPAAAATDTRAAGRVWTAARFGSKKKRISNTNYME